MLYTKIFTKSKKDIPGDEVSYSAQLLSQAGYVQKEMAGVYAYLPLGKKVLDKIIQIIREEMEFIGGQEILLGALQNPEVWGATGRWDDEVIDVWFKTKLKNGTELGLAPTHEEPLTNLMKRHIQSYKDLPVYAFQFQNKFRNELRARGGIIRARDFIMKDLYSFNRNIAGLDAFYEEAIKAYHRIFDRLGIGEKTYLTFADGGAFSKYSHEFQTVCAAGEDTIYLDRDKRLAVNKEVFNDEVLLDLGLDRSELEEVSAIEVGNIFKLGTKFSTGLGLLYTDENNEKKPVVMGSYGISPCRSMGTIVEVLADERGIVWPESVTPYKCHLVGLNMDNTIVCKKAYEVYQLLVREKVEVLFDDRLEVSAGGKFAEADLLGTPYRLVVSEKTGDKIELKRRTEQDTCLLSLEELVSKLR